MKRARGGRSAAWGQALVDKLIAEGRLPPDALERGRPVAAQAPAEAQATPAPPKPRMNNTETRFAQILDARLYANEIKAWRFEPFSLKLAPNVHYRADFIVAHQPPRRPEIIEVKGGFVREDAWVKFKLAASILGDFFDFTLAQYKGGKWSSTQMPR